jgi:hypothetical protein
MIAADGSSPVEIKEALARLVERKDLTADEMAGLVGRIMDGEGRRPRSGPCWRRCE